VETRTLKDLTNDQIKELEPELVSSLLFKAEHLAKTIKALKAQAHQLMTDGTEIPGWFLKPGNKVRKISDVAAAVKLLLESDLGLTPSDLLDLTDISAGVMTTAVAEKLDISGDKAKKKLAEVLGAVLTLTENAPSVSKVPKKKAEKKKK